MSYEKELQQLLQKNRFQTRRFSWVAEGETYFFKIPRVGKCIEEDLVHSKAIVKAEYEYKTLLFLHELDDVVQKPLALLDACLVMPLLRGQSILTEYSAKDTKTFQASLKEGITLCARMHRQPIHTFRDIPAYDYIENPFLQAVPKITECLNNRGRRLIMKGYEVRNFRRDACNGPLKFFDPHEIFLGAPEEDVCRYILSILMISWGRNRHCRIEKTFRVQKLFKHYENTRQENLDHSLLSYMFRFNVAMRKYYARQAVRQMHLLQKLLANIYYYGFFQQIAFWMNTHGF